ncbi:hypothetical protein HDU98_004403 [Podochytrium sp. JEL0797]|nr:hypothetical protein HDU98_004403 [Podochytrium sp. JEL0797]
MSQPQPGSATCLQQDHIASCTRCRAATSDAPAADECAVQQVERLFVAGSAATQGKMMSALLTLMRPMQLRCLAAKVAVLTRVDFIARLAPEVALKILHYLDAKSLCRAAQAARQWRMLADDDLIWHRMCEQHIDKKCKTCGWGLPIIRNSNNQKKRAIEDSNKRKRADSDSDSSTDIQHEQQQQQQQQQPKKRSWKSIYAERLLVERNWRKPKFITTDVQAHQDAIMCMQYNDCKGKYATGGRDHMVRIWDADTNTLIKELAGHTQGVTGLQFDESKIVTCSLDRTIRIWSMKTFECIRIMQGHRDGVCCIHYMEEFLASGSADASIRIWNISTGKYFTLTGHTDWVNKVQLYQKTKLFSCSDDRSVRLWDLETRQPLRIFSGHHDQVQSLSISLPQMRTARASIESRAHAPKLVTCSSDKTIKVWDIETGACIHTLFGHEDGVMCVASDTLRIVSGSHENVVMVWDLESGKLMHSMKMATVLGPGGARIVEDEQEMGVGGIVNCCAVSDTKIMTGSEDGVVRIHDFYPDELF